MRYPDSLPQSFRPGRWGKNRDILYVNMEIAGKGTEIRKDESFSKKNLAVSG
jgi:hypothetical protein